MWPDAERSLYFATAFLRRASYDKDQARDVESKEIEEETKDWREIIEYQLDDTFQAKNRAVIEDAQALLDLEGIINYVENMVLISGSFAWRGRWDPVPSNFSDLFHLFQQRTAAERIYSIIFNNSKLPLKLRENWSFVREALRNAKYIVSTRDWTKDDLRLQYSLDFFNSLEKNFIMFHETIGSATDGVSDIQSFANEIKDLALIFGKIEKIMPSIFAMVDFIRNHIPLAPLAPPTKTWGVIEDKALLPRELNERRHYRAHGTDFYVFLLDFYKTIRGNALSIINHNKGILASHRFKTPSLEEKHRRPLKRVKKKPKDFIPFSGLLPKELIAYIFKSSRNRDAALEETTKLSKYMKDDAMSSFLDIYQKMTGKGAVDWYRSYIYKKDDMIDTFMFSWQDIKDSDIPSIIFPSFNLKFAVFDLLKDSKIQNIFKIVSAMEESTSLVHNFQRLLIADDELKDSFIKIYKSGKGGLFKFDIVNRYMYVKDALYSNSMLTSRGEIVRDLIPDDVEEAIGIGLFSWEDFRDSIKEFTKISFDNIKRTDYDVIKSAESYLRATEKIKYVKKYEKKREDKNKFLFNLDESFSFEDKDIQFKVLRDRDPLHFFIGLETDCCQHLGGVGKHAAIDSYINKNAGVLVMYVDGNIVSQSYFHYVPLPSDYIPPPKNIDVLLSKSIEELDFDPEGDLLPNALVTRLKLTGILSIGDLVSKTGNELIKSRYIGRKTLKAVEKALKKIGLFLGMTEYKDRYHGIILDNVEAHPGRMRNLAISQKNIDKLYAKYSKIIADKLDLNYVKCGRIYNQLSDDAFGWGFMEEDLRKFKSKKVYTDFDYSNHLNLLDVKEDENNVYASLASLTHKFATLSKLI